MIIRHTARQQQDITQLNRNTARANDGSIRPIFNKEQKQLRQAQLITDIGQQVLDINQTHESIKATQAATQSMSQSDKRQALQREAQTKQDKTHPKNPLADNGPQAVNELAWQLAYDTALTQQGAQMGDNVRTGVHALVSALQGLAGGNIQTALAQDAAPYLAAKVKEITTSGKPHSELSQQQKLVKGLLSGQDYIKRSPDSEAMSKAQTIMNTWDYHKSNASIGDAPLMFGSSVLGITVKGMALNTAIGVGVNSVSQLSGSDSFSYVDAIMAGVTAAATTGKGIGSSAVINIGGAAVGSGIKGEDPTNSVIGAGFGSVAGSVDGKVITDKAAGIVKDTTASLTGAVGGSVIGEVFDTGTTELLDQTSKKNEGK